MLALGSLGGCTHQEFPADQWRQGETTELRIGVSRDASATPEEGVTKLRLIVFRSHRPDQDGDGQLVLNSVSANQSSFTEVVSTGFLDFYFIANEPTDLSSITTVEQLEAAVLTHSAAELASHPTPTAIPMYGCYKEVKAVAGGKTYVGNIEQSVFGLERLLAKVSVKLNVKNSNFPAGTGRQVTVDHVQVKSLPEQSYWIAKPYTATASMITTTQQNAATVTPPTDFDASWEHTFYVPEYTLSDPSKRAYVSVTAHQVSDATNTCEYLIPIGNAMDDAKRYGDRYDLTRNRHYTFTGNIKGYGNNDLELKLTVEDWKPVPVGGEAGEYVNFERNLMDDVETSDYITVAAGSVLKVECETNVGGWWVQARLSNNDIFASTAKSAAVTSATRQTQEMTIATLPVAPAKIETIEVCTNDLAGREVVIKQIFNDCGVIRSSVLAAAGWPADRLPPTGLQIAVRGRKVLPGGIAEGGDIMTSWGPEARSIPGTATGLGMGKGNTDVLMAENVNGSVLCPSADYCRSMGAEWYLPSVDELELIYTNHAFLGSSYTFSDSEVYWSSSEYSVTWGWLFIFNLVNGEKDYAYKTMAARVRCVREF